VKREGSAISGIIPSGIALLDDWISGVRDVGTHVLTGGSGSGKSAIAIHFVDAALKRGEPAAMLVTARSDDVRSHARFLGVNLDPPLRDGRLLLLRYRSDFVQRATHAASSEQVVGDLASLLAPHSPARIVIDSVAPFLGRAAVAHSIAVELAAWFDRIGSSTLLTFPEDLSAGYDRNLEPIVQAASAVIRLAREDADVRRAELVNLRYAAPAAAIRRFVIREDAGVVAERPVRDERLTLRAT
jgi:circadian clock protein KaiC